MSTLQVQVGGQTVNVQVQSSGVAAASALFTEFEAAADAATAATAADVVQTGLDVTAASDSADAAAASEAAAAATLAAAALRDGGSNLLNVATWRQNLGATVTGDALIVAVDAAAGRLALALDNVDNTSDANKPVSTAAQTALDLKANLASPTFTGTVSGISKSMVGLGSADDTSDANKPVSTATQTALDLKMAKASNLSDVANYVTARTNLQVIRAVTPEQQATATLAAIYAYTNLLPFQYDGATDLLIPLVFSGATTNAQRFDVLEAACNWQSQCILTGYGLIKFTIPDGLWDCGTEYIIRKKQQPPLWLEAASGTPTKVNITGISVVNVSGTNYEVTVTVGSALPSRVVVDYPIGLVFVAGDNDAEEFSGAAKVYSIAGDRLSFKYRRRFRAAPTAPTTISNAASTISGLTQSQLSIPFAAFAWSGGTASVEGFFNMNDGALGYSRYMGWSWNGTDATTDGSVIGTNRNGSFWYCLDNDVFVGGPTKTIRAALGGSFYANRSCFGGTEYSPAFTAINTQGGGELFLVRCSIGGCRTGPVSIGQATQFYVVQNAFAGGDSYCVELLGSQGLLYPNLITSGATGIYADLGAEAIIQYAAQEATVNYCDIGLVWDNGSKIIGTPTFTGNVSDAQDAGNILSIKGIWVKDTALAMDLSVGAVTATGLTISTDVPQITLSDTVSSTNATVYADLGHLRMRSHSSVRDVWIGYATTDVWQFDVSAAAVFASGSQILSTRKTGWSAATGTATRTAFATTTVTTAQLAERVKALIDDLISHGLIGA